MTRLHHLPDRQAGFTLIALGILLVVAMLALVAVLPGQEAGDANQKSLTTIVKLGKVEEAMRGFMALNGRRPCPADGQYGVNTANFGIEAANPGSCTGGAPAAPLSKTAVTITGATQANPCNIGLRPD